MISTIKRLLYRSLSLKNYLRLLQRSYFVLYHCGVLRLSRQYDYHYYVKRFICPGDVVLDIGANLGYYSILFARWTASGGEVHAVEPIPVYNAVFMERARRYPNITLYRCALGSEEKRIEMVMPLGCGYLRTGLAHVCDAERDGREKELRFNAEMRNPMQLFGSLKRLDYVKCDVEGFEYEVLASMEELLARLRPTVQVEVWPRTESKLFELFDRLGYNAFRLEKGTLAPTMVCGAGGDMIFMPG